MSLRGYWRTLNERMDCSPAMRMTRLTTMASTGRLTNRSVIFMTGSPPRGRDSVVLRPRRRVVGGLHLVVHAHGRAVAQLEHPGRHHLGARGEAREHGHLVAARAAQLHHLLAH